ncbi:MAG: restriction endonuclease subunit S [Gammaproteobacteria bacterium]|nr:MAG: restriction endonuclease subunit S [Gammaproteobacteria bacterium]
MGGEWREVLLEDVAADLTVGHVGPMASEYVEQGIPFLRSQNVEPLRINDKDLKFITEEFHGRLKKSALSPGDVVIVRTGKPGACAVIPQTLPVSNCSDLVIVRCGPDIEPRFLAYYVNSVATHHVNSHLVGAVQQHFNVGAARKLIVLLPGLDEQRAIAHILGTLDDKIELNRRMNETLEAMARALFKSWFVDFDPVRAKAEGRDPGLPQPLADLFPDSFEDSELGEIPREWRVARFADTIEIVGGGTPKTSVPEYWSGDIPWFSVVDAPTDSEVWVLDTEKKVTRAGVESSSTRVLPVGTTIISARGTVGRIALVGVPMAMNQSCYGLRGLAGTQGFFNYYSTRELVVRLQQHAHGSVFDTITRDTLAGVSVVVPPSELVEHFEKRVGPSLDRIRAALLEARTLANARDALLPKLISGELRVKAPARFLGGGD